MLYEFIQRGAAKSGAMVLLAVLWFVCLPVSAQILQGNWVDESEAAIDKHRKTDIAVIVLDRQDRAVQGAEVVVEQLRHDFVIGLTVPADRMPVDGVSMQPVYRCFNALSLDRINDWSSKPERSQLPSSQVLREWRQAIDPIHTTFGKVLSVDPAMNADELSLLEPEELHAVMMARLDYAVDFVTDSGHFDLYSDLLHRNMIEHKLGHGMVHRIFDYAHAKRPNAQFAIRVRDAISLGRGREMISTVQKLEVRQIAFDAITIEQRFNGIVNPNALKRMLDDYVGKLNKPVTLVGFEVAGETPVAAGINTETVLRQVFAQPNVVGLYVSGVNEDEVVESNAQLLDGFGEMTASGEAFDSLFRKHWWSSEKLKTDERGNAQARVFTGWYRVTAKLPNGKAITSDVYVPKSDRRRLIVLQATAIEEEP